LAAALLVGCGPSPGTLAGVRERGALTVAVLNGPTTYYEGAHGPQGAQYELASAFAARLGVGLQMVTLRDEAALREALADGEVDLVAGVISLDGAWSGVALPSSTALEVPQWVVGRRGEGAAASLADLADRRFVVLRGSPQEAMLRALQVSVRPGLSWEVVEGTRQEVLARVQSQKGALAIVDGDAFAYAQHQFPGLVRVMRVPQPRRGHWMVGRHSGQLLDRVDEFLGELQAGGRLAQLLVEAAPENPRFELNVSESLVRDIETELPALRPLFEAAAAETGLDWRLLAAVAYVESRWQAGAVSRDGARGVMMLTPVAAGEMGVRDLHDPGQNVMAGARYLLQVRGKIPERIPEPERSWFMIAAYNVGYGHLEDARVLAQRRGGSADRWRDVARALPLLADERYFREAKRGYARGWEPVRMVEKVQLFLKLLEWRGESLARPAEDVE
jgi:membrane-bound lytic murein transglycosylase F